VLPSPGPSTDSDGVFKAIITVPNLNPGPQKVMATVAGATARDTFTVTD
jgi:hypothetical protein